MIISFDEIRARIASEDTQIISIIRGKYHEYVQEINEIDEGKVPKGIIQYTNDLIDYITE